MSRAERFREIVLLVRADRGADFGVGQTRELDRHVPDAAGAGVDQYFLPRLDLDAVVQSLPGGDQHQRDCGRLLERQAFGFSGGEPVIDQRILCVIAQTLACRTLAVENLIARLESDRRLADGFDDPGAVAAEHRRQRRRVARGLGAHFRIHRVHAGGLHAHQQVGVARRLGIRQRLRLQHLWSAGSDHDDGFHAREKILPLLRGGMGFHDLAPARPGSVAGASRPRSARIARYDSATIHRANQFDGGDSAIQARP